MTERASLAVARLSRISALSDSDVGLRLCSPLYFNLEARASDFSTPQNTLSRTLDTLEVLNLESRLDMCDSTPAGRVCACEHVSAEESLGHGLAARGASVEDGGGGGLGVAVFLDEGRLAQPASV